MPLTKIEKLKSEDLLERQEDVTHRTPVSERSKVDVEFIIVVELTKGTKTSINKINKNLFLWASRF